MVRIWRKWKLSYTAGTMKNGTSLWKNNCLVVFLNSSAYICTMTHITQGTYPKAMKAIAHKKTCIQIFLPVLFVIVKTYKY